MTKNDYTLEKIGKKFKKVPKILFYPLILLIPFLFLCLLGINGSSIGTYNEAIDGNAGNNHIFGSNRWIRSDEYLATTPIILSQEALDNPKENNAIGTGINLNIQTNIPVKDLFVFFKPPAWMFILTNNVDFAYAFYWWFKVYLLAVGIYLLLFELTKRNYLISILGSLIFVFTPFAHWWWNFEFIGYASFILFAFIRIIDSKKIFHSIFYSFLLYYFSISFVLLLYPPFQVMLVWSGIFISLGYVLNNLRNIKKDLLIKKKLLVITFTIFFIISTIVLFYIQNRDVIELITQTAYPGVRTFEGGGLAITDHFGGFYNILLQSDYNGAPIGQRNQSEASDFFLYYPAILLFCLGTLILRKRKDSKTDYILLTTSLWLIFLALWSYIPFPAFLSKLTLLSQVPPSRIVIGLGFSSYLLTFYYLSTKFSVYKFGKIYSYVISIANSFLTLYLGIFYLIYTPQFFTKPILSTPEIKLALITVFVFISTYLLLNKKILLFLLSMLAFSFLSTFAVHPLYKGVDSITSTEFSKTINKYPSDQNNMWVVYGDHRFAQYLVANGEYVLNGIHYYPLFEMWKIIDPKGEYKDVYNRYAHIHFSDEEDTNPLVKLIYADQISVNLDPCDEKLKKLNVEYFILTEKRDYSCLVFDEVLNTNLRGPLYIYSRIGN